MGKKPKNPAKWEMKIPKETDIMKTNEYDIKKITKVVTNNGKVFCRVDWHPTYIDFNKLNGEGKILAIQKIRRQEIAYFKDVAKIKKRTQYPIKTRSQTKKMTNL